MNNFKVIYRFLRYLEKAMDYDEPDEKQLCASSYGISENRWNALLEMMAKEGYVDGIVVQHSADGMTAVSVSNPRITLKGLEYLNENSMMKKAAQAAKGIAEIIT